MAEATLMYIFHQLNSINSPLALQFQKSFKNRIDQGRNKDLVSVLMFLHHGVYSKANEFFTYSSKATIKTTATSLIKRLFPSDITEVDNSDEENEYTKLQRCIALFTKHKKKQQLGNIKALKKS